MTISEEFLAITTDGTKYPIIVTHEELIAAKNNGGIAIYGTPKIRIIADGRSVEESTGKIEAKILNKLEPIYRKWAINEGDNINYPPCAIDRLDEYLSSIPR